MGIFRERRLYGTEISYDSENSCEGLTNEIHFVFMPGRETTDVIFILS